MPDEEREDISPWLRDDWLVETSASDVDSNLRARAASDRGPVGGSATSGPSVPGRSTPHGAASRRRPSTGRALAATVGVAAIVVVGAVVLLRPGDETPDAASTTTDVRTSTVVTTDLGGTTATTRSVNPVPATGAPTTVTELVNTVAPPGPGGFTVLVPRAIAGALPPWAESNIVVPTALTGMATTEVVTLSSSGVVTLTTLPAGRTRSVDVTDMGTDAQLAVGDDSIVVFNSTELLRIRDGEPVTRTSLSDGVLFVQPWSGTGRFVITSPSFGSTPTEPTWVLEPNGELTQLGIELPDGESPLTRTFSPNGDLLVGAPGGVYAIDTDGEARRISSGELAATGPRHYAVQECDEQLRCTTSVVEWSTGASTPAILDAVTGLGYLDPTTRLSPDGRSIVYRDPESGQGRRRVLDVTTGVSIDGGALSQVFAPDSWAADSSGLFVVDRELEFIDRASGVVTEIDGSARIRAVGTFSTPPPG